MNNIVTEKSVEKLITRCLDFVGYQAVGNSIHSLILTDGEALKVTWFFNMIFDGQETAFTGHYLTTGNPKHDNMSFLSGLAIGLMIVKQRGSHVQSE